MSKKRASGVLVTASNGHLCFEIDKAKSSFYPIFCDLLMNEFRFIMMESCDEFVSEIVGEMSVNGIKIGVGWDNWSGVYALAYCEEGDKILESISSKINTAFKKENYEKYLCM